MAEKGTKDRKMLNNTQTDYPGKTKNDLMLLRGCGWTNRDADEGLRVWQCEDHVDEDRRGSAKRIGGKRGRDENLRATQKVSWHTTRAVVDDPVNRLGRKLEDREIPTGPATGQNTKTIRPRMAEKTRVWCARAVSTDAAKDEMGTQLASRPIPNDPDTLQTLQQLFQRCV